MAYTSVASRTKNAFMAGLFVLATIVLPFTGIQNVSAATLTWTGGGNGTTFSDGDNWSTGNAPVDGDVLNFSYTGLGSNTELNNNIDGLSVAGITASGTPSTYAAYIITGNDLTLTGNISNTASYSGTAQALVLDMNVILGDDVTVTGLVAFAGATNKVNIQNHTLTMTSTALACQSLNGLIGTGTVSIGGAGVALALGSANAGFSGAVNISAGSITLSNVAALGSGSLTVSGTASVSLYATSNSTWPNAFTLGGSGAIGAQHSSTNGCSGASSAGTYTATLTGNVTLTSDFEYNGSDNMVINGTYVDNGFDFTVKAGALGTLVTPQGESVAPTIETTLAGDQPSTSASVVNKETATLNGTRGTISVNPGGVLKGTGTATTLFNSGTVNPGNSPGTLTVLTVYSQSGTLQTEILNADTYDQLRVGEDYDDAGSAVVLNTGAILDVILFDGWVIEQGDQFRIIDNRSSTAVFGTFEGMPEGTQFVVDGITFSISYVGGDGNDVVLTALNAGTDPDAPNTGIVGFVQANPAIVAAVGLIGVLTLVIVSKVAARQRA